jgi:uncharacterized protein (TIRG00374 family)
MDTSEKPSRIPWRPLVVILLTVGLLWWFLRSLDFAEVWRSIKSARPGLIGAAILVTLVTYLFRALRWQQLLRPLGRTRFRQSFRMTVIGFAANFMLPGRVGEVLRPYLLARSEGFNAAATFATIIVERVLDLASVMSLFAWFLLFSGMDVGRELTIAGAVSALLALVFLVLLAIGAGHPERLGRLSERLTRPLPARTAAAIGRFVRTFVEGLAVLRHPAPLVISFALSVGLWMSISAAIWFTSQAFDLTFSFTGSFLVVTFLMVGVSLPTPAGLGGFQWAYLGAVTGFFNAPRDTAGACALVLHAVSVVPVCLLGLVYMAQDGLTLAGLRRMKSTAEEAEGRGPAT